MSNLFPDTLKIGVHKYKIKHPHTFDSDNLTGQHCSETAEIRIKERTLSGEMQTDTAQTVCFFHEILHAIDNIYCMNSIGKECNAEYLIDALAEGLVQVLFDNNLYNEQGAKYSVGKTDKRG